MSLSDAREKQIPALDLLIKREKGVGARPMCCTGTIYNIRSSVIGGFSGNLFFARKSFCPLARVGRYIGRDRWEETGGVKRDREKESVCMRVCMRVCACAYEGEREKGRNEREDREKRWREVMVGRVILLLMCVTRSTRPRTHHHRDNGVGGSRRRDAGWFGARSTGGSQQKPPLNDPAPSCTTIKSS